VHGQDVHIDKVLGSLRALLVNKD